MYKRGAVPSAPMTGAITGSEELNFLFIICTLYHKQEEIKLCKNFILIPPG